MFGQFRWFLTATEINCLVVRDYLTWKNTFFSFGINSLRHIYFWPTGHSDFAVCFHIRSRMIQEDTWDRPLLLHNPNPSHPLRKSSCTGHLLFPPHLTQIHISPSPFSPVFLSAFSPLNVSGLPIFPRSSPILSSGITVFLYLYIPVWPASLFLNLFLSLSPLLSYKGQIKAGKHPPKQEAQDGGRGEG